jgi:curved DNA-binding protein CbpA
MPQLVDGVDMRTLPIGPEEAFVLSRVDGVSSEADIVAATGLDADRVRDTLMRLAELGAIRFEEAATKQPRQQRPAADPRAEARSALAHPIIESRAGAGSGSHPAAALYDPSELDEAVDIDLPRRRKILDLYYRLESLNHYELLEVSRDADKPALKEAYYQIVNVFHPDRYFGKSLGSFKPKLEKVFQRVTEALDTLTRKKSREDYDQYLTTQRRSRDLEKMLTDERVRAAEVDRIRRHIEEEARIAERARHTTPPQPMDPEARRRLLARKLGHSAASARPPGPPSVPVSQEAIREKVATDLKRRYEDHVRAAQAERIHHYVAAAELAIEQDNPVSAANALRIAAGLAPDDHELSKKLDEVQQRANQELAQTYLDQAQYEERSGRYAEAARSYQKAASGKPSARLFERAAFCLLEAGGDLRQAGEHAKKAVAMAPEDARIRLTLARVYLAAKMLQSAQIELERAEKIAPGDDTVKDWLRRIKRGEV